MKKKKIKKRKKKEVKIKSFTAGLWHTLVGYGTVALIYDSKESVKIGETVLIDRKKYYIKGIEIYSMKKAPKPIGLLVIPA